MKWRPWSVTCDVCGFEFDADEVKKRWDGMIVCDADFEYRHEQDFLRAGRNSKPVPFTRPSRDGEIDISPIYMDMWFYVQPTESSDVFSSGVEVPASDGFMSLAANEAADFGDVSSNFNASLSSTEGADTTSITFSAAASDMALSSTEASDTTNNSFNVQLNFSLESVTDSSSQTSEVELDGASATATMALSPKINGQWGGFSESGAWTNTNSYFGSPNNATSASGIYWRWTSGSPNYTNMTQNTWYPVGYDYYYVGSTITSGSPGSEACTVTVQFAYDGSGTGATTAGTWTLTASIVDNF